MLGVGPLGAAPALAQATAPAAQAAPSAPKLESRLREVIADLQAGKPSLDQMEPALGDAVKQQQAAMAPVFAQLGPVKSVTYDGLKQGAESYRVVFEQGAPIWLIALGSSGKLGALYFSQAQ
jgi:hypothetical protein